MIKRPTWIVLILLILALGGYFFLKYRPPAALAPTPTATANGFLLPSSGPKIKSVRISDQDNHVTQFDLDSSGQWTVSLPTPAPADQASAEEAVTQVEALSIVTKLDNSPPQGAMGLSSPAEIIQVAYADGSQHTLEVGSKTPTSSGYYVRLDHNQVYVISTDGIDPLVQLLTAPPYVPTPTPVSPTSSPTP